MTSSDRITDLEIRIAELERANEEMSEVATDQWKKIEALRRTVARLAERLLELEENNGGDPPVTKPPHW